MDRVPRGAFAVIWLVLGVTLACLLPIAAWVLEARVDPVGVLTALAVIPLLIGALLLLGTVNRWRGCLRRVGGAVALRLRVCVPTAANANDLDELQNRRGGSPRKALRIDHPREPCRTPSRASSFCSAAGQSSPMSEGVVEHLLRNPTCGLALVGAGSESLFLSHHGRSQG